MTYYGRWTYKYEEAARHGAAAAIIVHETIPAAYGWQVVRSSNSGSTATGWRPRTRTMSMVPIEGWVTLDTAQDLFSRAGLDYAKEKAGRQQAGLPCRRDAGRDAERASVHSTSPHLQHAAMWSA